MPRVTSLPLNLTQPYSTSLNFQLRRCTTAKGASDTRHQHQEHHSFTPASIGIICIMRKRLGRSQVYNILLLDDAFGSRSKCKMSSAIECCWKVLSSELDSQPSTVRNVSLIHYSHYELLNTMSAMNIFAIGRFVQVMLYYNWGEPRKCSMHT